MKALIEIALSQVGVKEIPGAEHCPDVLKYFHQCGFTGIRDDETAWCAAYVNWCAHMAGYQGSGALDARSLLKIGTPVEVPLLGDIAVFWRESPESWKGHVGFPIGKITDEVPLLGGNQNNQVCIKPYPEERVLGYRRLTFRGWK